MEPSRDYPTPYPGKVRQRPFTRSSMKEQENKTSNELNGATAVALRREKHVSSVSRSVNTFNLSASDKPSRLSGRLSVPSKYATPVSNSEERESVPTISENKSTTAKPSPLHGASLIKTGKSSGIEDKAKASTKKLSTSFQGSSVKTQGKANVPNKDTLSSPQVSSRPSASTMLPENSNCGQRRKFSTLMSSSYWLTQIKLSESAGMHAVSLGFFHLALKSTAEPWQRLCNELKSYARKHNVLQLESDAKDVLESYGILQEVMSSEIGEHLVVTEDAGKGFLVESKGFMAGTNEMCSPLSITHEEKSIGVPNIESSKTLEDECQAVVDTSRLHVLPALKDMLHSSSEESEICSSKNVGGEVVAHGNMNMQGIVQEGRSKIKVLSNKANLTEGKGNGDRKRHNIAQTSVLKNKTSTEKGDLIATGEMECVDVTTCNGSIPDRKKIIQKRTKPINVPAIKSQMPIVRKSLDGESAEQATVPNTSRCRTTHSCIIMTRKNAPHRRKNYKQLENKDDASSQSGLPSYAENGTEECNENLV